MKALTCSATRRRLQAFHDRELSISEQIDVSAHLEWCDTCAESLADMRAIGSLLKVAAPGRHPLSDEETISLQALVVNRAKAEHTTSWTVRLHEMFDDMHMIYAGLGAGAATVVCVMILLSMMRFATSERSPGSNQNPVVIDARTLMPKALDQNFLAVPDSRDDESVFTLSAIVTREGHVVNVELHAPDDAQLKAGSSEALAMKSLIDAISLARFEPARVSGLPVAVNMVWLIARTTVRGTKEPLFDASTVPVPSSKKRRATPTIEVGSNATLPRSSV
jgi:anti-sigma factor RsiW